VEGSAVTATTDFLAPNILKGRGRAGPPVPHFLRRTLTTILRRFGTGSIAQRLIAMPKQIAITFWSLVAACIFAFGVVAVMIAH
jgi:hypothetical protein